METVVNVNNFLNGIVWGPVGLALLFIAGLVMTFRTKWFQVSHFGHWMKKTIGAIFTNKHVTAHTGAGDKAISQFQTSAPRWPRPSAPVTSSVCPPPSSAAARAPSSGCGSRPWSA